MAATRTSTPTSLDSILTPYECTAARFIHDTVPGEGDMYPSLRSYCLQYKALLIHGEMTTLFPLAAHPHIYFRRFWHEDQYANANGFRLSNLLSAALQAYMS